MYSLPEVKQPGQMDHISNQEPLYISNSIGASLEDLDLWTRFHQEGTEMIITKSGRRMFPQCKIRLFGLLPYTKYVVLVDFAPVGNMRYKWNKHKWEVAGKAEPHPPCRTYIHPDSPAPGAHWMKDVIGFQKLKLTNNTLDQQGHIILHSMHCYKPRFHIVQSDDVYNLRWALMQMFSFPETEFTAVTAYQNEKITKLKIDHNPFAKGFREQERGHKRGGNLKNGPRSPNGGQKRKTWEDNEEPLIAVTDNAKVPRMKEEPIVTAVDFYHNWVPEQEGGSFLTPNSPDLTENTNREQQVPSSSSSLLYRNPYRRGPPPPPLPMCGDMGDLPNGRHSPDVATVPDSDLCQQPVFPTIQSSQDRSSALGMDMDSAGKQALRGPVCSPYGADQWMVPTQGPYRSLGYSTYSSDFTTTQGAVSHPHGGMTEWTQYPFLPFTCW
uniref:T-box domain-containing protein n=1 Tax=Leptobrachium leishanense TaxID=445787 RepID=A0A8C5LLT3_9ANUR